jgi:hypothetical protein
LSDSSYPTKTQQFTLLDGRCGFDTTKIVMENGLAKVFVNGIELKHVTDVQLIIKSRNLPTLMITQVVLTSPTKVKEREDK